MNFVRVSTRLFCDIFEAFRGLTKDSRRSVWAGKVDDQLVVGDQSLRMVEVSEIQNQKVVWSLPEKGIKMTFNIMQCAAKTEYCTEIHLMVENEEGPIETSEIKGLTQLGEALLEQLRQHYNKDWVILDTDLHLGQLRGSI